MDDMLIPDGMVVKIYNNGNTYYGILHMVSQTLEILGSGSNVHIKTGNDIVFDGSAGTIRGTNSVLTFGAAGDSISFGANIIGNIAIGGKVTVDLSVEVKRAIVSMQGTNAPLRIAFPGGAAYSTPSTDLNTGAIKITLPQSWTSTMLRMVIRIYDYAAGESFDVVVSGYNYPSTWANCPSAYIIGEIDRNFSVRFAHDGTKCCILIGETTSTWNYPQIFVTEFMAGYGNKLDTQWDTGWSISIVSSFTGITTTATRSNVQIGKYHGGVATILEGDARLTNNRTPNDHTHAGVGTGGQIAYSALSGLPTLLALGETSVTAYRGDNGKTAYDHSQTNHSSVYRTTKTFSPVANTWYRIATSAVDIGRNSGRFAIDWTVSGSHGSARFTASCHYGVANSISIQQLEYGIFTNGITEIRIIYHPTYSTNYAYIEVKYNASITNLVVNVEATDLLGWSLIDASTAGSIPAGYTNYSRAFVATVVSGTFTKVTINTGGMVTLGATATVSDIPVSNTDKLLGRYTAGAGGAEEIACTAAGRALLDDADNIAQRATLGLGAAATRAVDTTPTDASTNLIESNAVFDGLAGKANSSHSHTEDQITLAGANVIIGTVGAAGAAGEIACTAAGRALLDDADASAQRTTLGLGNAATKSIFVQSASPTGVDGDIWFMI